MTVMAELVLRPIALLRKGLLGKKRKGKYSQFVGKKKKKTFPPLRTHPLKQN